MTLLGIDIGTSSSKAVVTDDRGQVVASAMRPHVTASQQPGWFEHDADTVWWADVLALVGQLRNQTDLGYVDAVGVSGIGPVTLLADRAGRPLREAILYGIDTRAQKQIGDLSTELGEPDLLTTNGNLLTSQSVGPKLRWIAEHEPQVWSAARRWYSASGYIVGRLTGEYIVDHYTASASDPLYDLRSHTWWQSGWEASASPLERPRLVWPDEIAGTVTQGAGERTGLRPGTPVVAGTVDAMAEAYSAGCVNAGDTMVMYGSTLFFIQVAAKPLSDPGLWAVSGLSPETFGVAAGMATSGLITNWLADLANATVAEMFSAAAKVPAGSEGLVLLPYFAGERTPLFDPNARGCWIGLTLQHGRAHLARSVLEGVAFGVRHNIETMDQAGANPKRLVAVGGGTQGDLWMQIVSDVCNLPQDVPSVTVGASFGDARMAADALGIDTSDWNPVKRRIEPDPRVGATYQQLYGVYRRAYTALLDDLHLLAKESGGQELI